MAAEVPRINGFIERKYITLFSDKKRTLGEKRFLLGSESSSHILPHKHHCFLFNAVNNQPSELLAKSLIISQNCCVSHYIYEEPPLGKLLMSFGTRQNYGC